MEIQPYIKGAKKIIRKIFPEQEKEDEHPYREIRIKTEQAYYKRIRRSNPRRVLLEERREKRWVDHESKER